jgi:hypothetical protein
MHVAGADRPDEGLLPDPAQREGDKKRPSRRRSADCAQPLLCQRMIGIRIDGRLSFKQRLNLRERNAVLLAFGRVSVIPIETSDLMTHDNRLDVCLYKCNAFLTAEWLLTLSRFLWISVQSRIWLALLHELAE